MSRHVDPHDRNTAALFGDGAGAIVCVAGPGGSIGPVVLGSDGAHASLIVADRDTQLLAMEGHETFKQAVRRLGEATLAACERAGVTLADIDLFVYHQANRRILASLAERLGLPAERVLDRIAEHGNTSAASVPLALLADARCSRVCSCPARACCFAAAGSGFTWGACTRPSGVAHERVGGPVAARWGLARSSRARHAGLVLLSRSPSRRTAGRCAVNIPLRSRGRAGDGRRDRSDRRAGRGLPGRRRPPDGAAELLDGVHGEFGQVGVLVNNAGVRADGLTLSLTDEDWQRVLDTNLGATFRMTRAVLREMIRARFGRIINMASIVGPRANGGQANYAASKAAVIGFTKTVAVEVARRGVTVYAVAPGLITTDMTEYLPPALAEKIPRA